MKTKKESVMLYVGCGTDARPLDAFPFVKKFIYIDSQPATQFPWQNCTVSTFNNQFVFQLVESLQSKGFGVSDDDFQNKMSRYQKFGVVSTKPKRIEFINRDKTRSVVCYLNGVFPFHILHPKRQTDEAKAIYKQFLDDVKRTNMLNVCDFSVHHSILKFMSKPIDIYAWPSTCLEFDEVDRDNITSFLHEHPEISENKDVIQSMNLIEKVYVTKKMPSFQKLVARSNKK